MVSSFNISLSGLNAASKRFEVSATNVANQRSTATIVDGEKIDRPYAAKRVEQLSHASGGVETKVVDKNPPTVTIFDPGSPNADANGSAEVPNVNLDEEAVNQVIASYDYRANLKALKTSDDLLRNSLDIET